MPDHYILALTHDEIRDTRMALVAYAGSYRDMAKNEAFSPTLRAMLEQEAKAALGIADKINHVINRSALLAIA
jgi:hypothetical protein